MNDTIHEPIISAEEGKVVNVLVTGFQPFGDPLPDTNPSWEAIKHLNGISFKEDGVIFKLTCKEIPVEYAPVETLLPTFHQVDYDYFVHVGQGDKQKIKLESRASSYGYIRLDNLHQCPKDGLAPLKYLAHGANPKAYTCYTSIDTIALAKYLETEKGCKWAVPSDDAGRYLCEYTFYCSMGEATIFNSTKGKEKQHVLFVHVPVPDDIMTLDMITDTLKLIIFAIPNFS